MKELGAVILAAGMSTRMGAFKQLLKIDGVPLIERVYQTMKRAGAEKIVIVTGFRAADIREAMAGENVTFVNNDNYATTQQIDSLRLGLGAFSVEYKKILVTPADVPLVTDKTVKLILNSKGAFVRPVYDGKPGHPVLISADLARVVNDYRGEGGLRGAIDSSGIAITDVAVDDIAITMDSDTPADFKALEELYKARSGSAHLK